jgi:hypothetical protein
MRNHLVRQTSIWILAILGQDKMKSLMLWFLKLLMNKLPLMYLIVRGSKPLLESSKAAVPHLGAAVPHPL